MNTADLAELLASSHSMTRADARRAVDEVFKAIGDAAVLGEEISFSGFGKFKLQTTKAREGRHPATGAPIQIAASKKISFTAGKVLKDKLNG
jgi:DNA-binding protein HU-beta